MRVHFHVVHLSTILQSLYSFFPTKSIDLFTNPIKDLHTCWTYRKTTNSLVSKHQQRKFPYRLFIATGVKFLYLKVVSIYNTKLHRYTNHLWSLIRIVTPLLRIANTSNENRNLWSCVRIQQSSTNRSQLNIFMKKE